MYLGAAFGVTFLLFSLTSFQLDYYTVIVFPFAAIGCGGYLARVLASPERPRGLELACPAPQRCDRQSQHTV